MIYYFLCDRRRWIYHSWEIPCIDRAIFVVSELRFLMSLIEIFNDWCLTLWLNTYCSVISSILCTIYRQLSVQIRSFLSEGLKSTAPKTIPRPQRKLWICICIFPMRPRHSASSLRCTRKHLLSISDATKIEWLCMFYRIHWRIKMAKISWFFQISWISRARAT